MNTDSTDDTNKTFKKAGKLLENTTLKKYCHDKINDFWLWFAFLIFLLLGNYSVTK